LKNTKKPKLSLETQKLRAALKAAFDTPYLGGNKSIGAFTCGVYAFFDYDNEPIYVGQTFEGLSSRIGRHLTNQRTDAVAMAVLDPFEVFAVEMYPLVKHDGVKKTLADGERRRKNPEFDNAKADLNALELTVFRACIAKSRFKAILNEKDPAPTDRVVEVPRPVRAEIVSDEVQQIRGHADVRIARRAQTISRLAQVISERQVSVGLRRSLLVQAQRLEFLADEQLRAWGGFGAVPKKTPHSSEDDEDETAIP
jgi:GIY-YIG catalytic domain